MNGNELFEMCRRLAEAGPSAAATRRLHELLVLCCAEGCRRKGGTFGNLFAQVDFLCRQHGFKGDEQRELHALRRHSNGNGSVEPAQWPYDLRALALLAQAVFGMSMPGELRRLLPAMGRTWNHEPAVNLRYVRCIVEEWDDRYIMARNADMELAIDYANQEQGRDFGYLRKLLRTGMQLNVLDGKVADAEEKLVEGRARMVLPGQVVVEPDFLIDISSIAACFTNYGHHPLLYTLHRMEPKTVTQDMLLGNFAGTALDDAIGAASHQATLSASLRRSFREQALRFCACPDFDARRFKDDAEQQVRNIGEAVGMMFGNAGEREKAMVEPSFVCERLGLQGRVDLMTTDLNLLVEQKSGRNMKIERQSHDSHGLQLESHYVQLLLYYGVLRYNFGRQAQHTDIKLLYSRYAAARGVLNVNYYQQLFREAIRLRNQIVATELLMAREGFGRIVPHLTVSVVYKGVAQDHFFHEYVEPDLLALNEQLHALTPTERTYYERMMTFVYREQACQKLGSSEARLHHGGGTASDLWLMPLGEKEETGNIFVQLSVVTVEQSDRDGGYDLVTLQRNDGQRDVCSNFRNGDMVYLYAYEGVPDVRRSILYKGTLESMEGAKLTVRLTNGQRNTALLGAKGTTWAVEHGGSDLPTTAAIRGMQQWASAKADRRALLLGVRTPEGDPTVELPHSYHPHYDDIVRRAMQARDFFLLVGPPGTGKTSMALRFMVDASLGSRRDGSLLLLSYTNRAVDEICSMLTDAGMDFLRMGNKASCDLRFRSKLIDSKIGESGSLAEMKRRIAETRIVVGTTSTVQSRQELFLLKHFALCIVDEASQILEPQLVGLLSMEQIDRFILIGDHKQLPAVVQQSADDARVEEQCLRELCIDDCRQSLFERLLRRERQCGRTQFVGTLRHQGRMHPEVALFPATAFYDDVRLEPVPLPHQQTASLHYELPAQDALDRLLQERRMVFLDCASDDGGDMVQNPQRSVSEARMVAMLLARIHRFYGERFDASRTVGIIVPYRAQIAAIRQETERLDIEGLQDVSIDTVERYQGSQRDVIIYSFTVSHEWQLDFLAANTFVDHGHLIDRKLNVALTRARCQMIMVGRASVLRHNPLFSQLVASFSATDEHGRSVIAADEHGLSRTEYNSSGRTRTYTDGV